MSCTALREPLEIWFYDQGAEPIRRFLRGDLPGPRRTGHRAGGRSRASACWSTPPAAIGKTDQELVQLLDDECGRSGELFSAIGQAVDLGQLRAKGWWPTPSEEWVLAFAARTTDLKEGAEQLDAALELSYPGRNQSRTVVQGFLKVPRAQLAPTQLGDNAFYNLVVDGEVLRQGELFESFRYRFDFPAAGAPDEVPLIVQRYLRPGPYKLILRVEDAASARMARRELELEVPRWDPAAWRRRRRRRCRLPTALAAPAGPAASRRRRRPRPRWSPRRRMPRCSTRPTASLAAAGDQSIKIVPLRDGLQLGKVRVEARTRGEGIARVAFELNGRRVMSKARRPSASRSTSAANRGCTGSRWWRWTPRARQLASDETLMNAGPHRFALRLIEPQLGKNLRKEPAGARRGRGAGRRAARPGGDLPRGDPGRHPLPAALRAADPAGQAGRPFLRAGGRLPRRRQHGGGRGLRQRARVRGRARGAVRRALRRGGRQEGRFRVRTSRPRTSR